MRATHFTLALLLAMGFASRYVAFGGALRNSERERSRAAAARVEREWPLLNTGPVPVFIQRLGNQLAQAAGPALYPWRFTVIRDYAANAFALGDGRIYVSDGTILVCRAEAELAAILAHEMGHQLAGHFQTSQGHGLHRRLLSLLGIGKADTTDVTIGSLSQKMDPAKEMEADRWSVRILVVAGYDPRAALHVAQRVLGRPAGDGERHFDNTKRIAALAQLLTEISPGGRTDSVAFRRLRRQIADEP